jgi:hypothetical protein
MVQPKRLSCTRRVQDNMPRPKIDEDAIQEIDRLMGKYLEVPPETVSTNRKLKILLKKHRNLRNNQNTNLIDR